MAAPWDDEGGEEAVTLADAGLETSALGCREDDDEEGLDAALGSWEAAALGGWEAALDGLEAARGAAAGVDALQKIFFITYINDAYITIHHIV